MCCSPGKLHKRDCGVRTASRLVHDAWFVRRCSLEATQLCGAHKVCELEFASSGRARPVQAVSSSNRVRYAATFCTFTCTKAMLTLWCSAPCSAVPGPSPCGSAAVALPSALPGAHTSCGTVCTLLQTLRSVHHVACVPCLADLKFEGSESEGRSLRPSRLQHCMCSHLDNLARELCPSLGSARCRNSTFKSCRLPCTT